MHRVALDTSLAFSGADAGGPLGSAQFGNAAPLLGKGNKLYIVGDDGALRVLDRTTLTQQWAWTGVLPASAPAGSISALNIDINRSVAVPCGPGQPGVLYVAATKAGVTSLFAVLVDSQGIDDVAPWPRHQHDPANTGNAATSLAPWTCP